MSFLASNLTTSTIGYAKRSLLGSDYDDLFDSSQTNTAGVNPGIGSSSHNSTMNYILEDILASFQMEWELPIALMLVSLVWWENFVDRDIKFGSYKLVNMKLLKENIVATRCKTNFISSMWKVVITLMFAYIFHPGIFNTSKVFQTRDESSELNRFKFHGGMGGMGDFPGWPPGMGGGGVGGVPQMPNMLNPTQIGMPPPPPIPFRKRRDVGAAFPVAAVANHTPIAMRQMFDPMFTAPQMFIPSLSTLPNNMMNPNGDAANEPPPVDNSYKDRWITYLLPMILQVSLVICLNIS